MLSYIMSLPDARLEATPEQGPLALVMAPTRELAQQIEEECRKFAKFTGERVHLFEIYFQTLHECFLIEVGC
jgi:superfamily II DNA/RNA helicase